jgi:hypothetical protein
VQSKLLLSRFTVFEIPEYTSRVWSNINQSN